METILSPEQWLLKTYGKVNMNLILTQSRVERALKEYGEYVRDVTLKVAAENTLTETDTDWHLDGSSYDYEIVDKNSILSLSTSELLKIE